MVTLNLNESLPVGIEIKFNNIALENGNGGKTIVAHWDQPLLKFDLSRQSPGTYDNIREYIIDFFKEHKGAHDVFRYNDPSDNSVTNIAITGDYTDKSYGICEPNEDGSKYQLFKVYELDGIKSYRPITRPINDSDFVIYNHSNPITTGFLVNHETGVITMNTPDLTQTLTWSGNFDVPVRFATDAIRLVTESKILNVRTG